MNLRHKWLVILPGVLLFLQIGYAQEEESAEVFLEDYTDEFQEAFFDALKQKGIENYDKAINLFLKCKDLDESYKVIDFELAKCYLANKDYILAQQYGIEALNSEPENLWYLDILVDIMDKQGNDLKMIQEQIIYDNDVLQENLAVVYFHRKNYQKALNVLKEMKNTSFKTTLSRKINDSLDQINKKKEIKQVTTLQNKNNDPLKNYKSEIEELIRNEDYSPLIKKAEEALEQFPSQPYFYYAKGMGLSRSGNQIEAISELEVALDFLIDDIQLGNNIYKELANAHTFLGNTSKANMYLSKIKSGS